MTAPPEKFVLGQTGRSIALKDTQGSVFSPSGSSHSVGLVPDPGSTAHTPAYYLGDDGQFHAITFNAFNPAPLVDFQTVLGGGVAVITTGTKTWLHVCFNATITAWRISSDQSGSISVDIQRVHDANIGGLASIVGGGNTPSLSSAQFSEQVPSGWTSTSLVADDWIAFVVTGSPSSITQVTVCLTCNRTS